MSRDKYSDNHTIESLPGKSFRIITTDEGQIGLFTKGDDGHIYIHTGEAGESGGTIFLENKICNSANDISIQ